jgi:hypothetical protein
MTLFVARPAIFVTATSMSGSKNALNSTLSGTPPVS